MTLRTTFIVIIMIIGLVFFLPSNPYTDIITKPIVKIVKKASSYFSDELNIPMPEKETKVYKWQDQNGEWHFSNTPPPEGIVSQSKTYKNDDNIVPAPKADN